MYLYNILTFSFFQLHTGSAIGFCSRISTGFRWCNWISCAVRPLRPFLSVKCLPVWNRYNHHLADSRGRTEFAFAAVPLLKAIHMPDTKHLAHSSFTIFTPPFFVHASTRKMVKTPPPRIQCCVVFDTPPPAQFWLSNIATGGEGFSTNNLGDACTVLRHNYIVFPIEVSTHCFQNFVVTFRAARLAVEACRPHTVRAGALGGRRCRLLFSNSSFFAFLDFCIFSFLKVTLLNDFSHSPDHKNHVSKN